MSSPNPSASAVREEQRRLFARIADLEAEAARLKRLAGIETDGSARPPHATLGLPASGVVHDFAALLTCVLAEADLSLATLTQAAPERERIERIRNLAIRAGALAQEVLDGANRDTARKPADLSRLTDETLQLLTSSFPVGVVVEMEFPDNLPAANVNYAQIQRVVMNLIANALEAIGEKNGVISLRASEIAPAAGEDHGHIRLEVRDTGCGMPAEAQTRIFDPRYSTKAHGRGLGLASVWEIVRAHGGTIEVASAPGQGSRFEILLPAAAPVELAPAAEDRSQHTTVLFIEDDELLRHVVTRLFREKGFGVLAAPDGKSALDLFRAKHAEVGAVFLDVTLPEMSGREILEELRRIQPDVKVILTTAHSEDAALAAVGGQQPWRFIRKPYRLLELIGLIQDARLTSGTGGAHA
jgi:two-component system cell cycle sensor histidine kinase/response regulator CckA